MSVVKSRNSNRSRVDSVEGGPHFSNCLALLN